MISKPKYKRYSNKKYAVDIKKDIETNGKEESSEINPLAYGQLIFNKDVKIIQQGNDNLFNK